jgi:Flp pilus assembly protein TadB
MNPLAVLLFLVAAAMGVVLAVSLFKRTDEETPERVAAWESAMAQEGSAVGRIFQSLARPVSRVDVLGAKMLSTRQYRFLQSRLIAAGRFAGDPEIFLSIQVVALLVAIGVLALALVASGTLAQVALVLMAIGLVFYPWNLVSKAAKEKADAVTAMLPEFAELLQMTIASGAMGLESALAFTAERTPGIVSDEVRNMLLVIRANPADEAAAYALAGERLGTPEAKTFFASIYQAQVQGAKILENLASQSRQLRTSAFHLQRANIKKLPNKLVIVFGIHLMPLMFVAAILPAIYGLAHMGQS